MYIQTTSFIQKPIIRTFLSTGQTSVHLKSMCFMCTTRGIIAQCIPVCCGVMLVSEVIIWLLDKWTVPTDISIARPSLCDFMLKRLTTPKFQLSGLFSFHHKSPDNRGSTVLYGQRMCLYTCCFISCRMHGFRWRMQGAGTATCAIPVHALDYWRFNQTGSSNFKQFSKLETRCSL